MRRWCPLGSVVNCSFLSKWQGQGCERAFKPPLCSHVLSLIGVCLFPCSRQHLQALKLLPDFLRGPGKWGETLQGTLLALITPEAASTETKAMGCWVHGRFLHHSALIKGLCYKWGWLVVQNSPRLSLVLVAPVDTQMSILWQAPEEFPHPLEGDACLCCQPLSSQQKAATPSERSCCWAGVSHCGVDPSYYNAACLFISHLMWNSTSSRSFLCSLYSLLHHASSEYNCVPGLVDRRRLWGQFWLGHPLAYSLQSLRLRLLVPTGVQSLSVSESTRGGLLPLGERCVVAEECPSGELDKDEGFDIWTSHCLQNCFQRRMWRLLNSRWRAEGHLPPRIGGEQHRVVCHFCEDEIHISPKYLRLSSTLITV